MRLKSNQIENGEFLLIFIRALDTTETIRINLTAFFKKDQK